MSQTPDQFAATLLAPDSGSSSTAASEAIAAKVIAVIAATKSLPTEAVRPESTLEELGIDSLDRLNILFDLEGAFDVSINDEEARQVRTVDEMIAGIGQLLTAKEQGGAVRPAENAALPAENGPVESGPARQVAPQNQAAAEPDDTKGPDPADGR